MNHIYKESTFYLVICRMMNFLSAFSKKSSETFSWLYKNSTYNKVVSSILKYFEKGSNFDKSFFYKLMCHLGRHLKNAAERLYDFFCIQLEYSFLSKAINKSINALQKDPYIISGLLFAGFLVGYGASGFSKKEISKEFLIILLALLFLSAILIFLKEKTLSVLRESLVFRFFSKIVKSLLP